MAQTFTGRKRVRKVFGHVKEVGEMPNLIEVQKASYEQFLLMDAPKGGRPTEGLQAVFKSVFPIKDFADTAHLEFVKYEYEDPKYDLDECRQRGMTYAAPLKVTLRLIVFDVDPETQAKSVKDIKEQDVYMGDMPLMTPNGTFIVNGTERVIVSQMHRSPGVFFDHDKGKSHSSGKLLFAARIIPYRGSWLDIEFDAKDIVYARIDRRRKIPVTSLLYALGLDGEEILKTFYRRIVYTRMKDGWRVPYDPERSKGVKFTVDQIDADTGEVAIEAGRKMTARSARQLADKGVKALLAADADLFGQYIAEDLYNPADRRDLRRGRRRNHREVARGAARDGLHRIADSRHRPHQRRSLHPQHAQGRQERLARGRPVRHLPGDASGRAADHRERGGDVPVAVLRLRALRPLGRRPGQDEHAPRPRRARHAAHAAQGRHSRCGQGAGRPARRARRNRRHRPSRQPPGALGRRADGEPVPHRPPADGARDQGAHVVGRDRHDHAAGPDQREARGGGRARILRFLAAVPVHGPDQPALRDHPQAPPFGAWPRRPHPRAGGLRSARRASDPLRPHLPDRNAGRAEHRPHQLARDLRAGEQVRLHREPVSTGARRQGDRGGRLPVGDGGAEIRRRAGRHADRRQRPSRGRPDRLPTVGRRRSAGGRPRRLHGRVAEAARFGRRGADPVPRERRRQPGADGLEHAAPGGAAGALRRAAGRHRHGGDRGARFGRGDRCAPGRNHRPDRRDPHRHPRHRRDRRGQARRRHLPADEVPALEPVDLHQPEAAGEGRRSRRSRRHHRRRSVDRSRRSGARPQRARRLHAVERLQLRGLHPALRAHRQGRRLHLDPHRGVRGDGPRHQARAGGDHPRHSQRLGRGAEKPRRGGHRLYRRRGAGGRHPGRQDHAEGRKPDDARRETASRHLRREGFRRARHQPARSAGRPGHDRRSARLQPPRRRQGRARPGDRARGDRAARQGPRRRAGDPRPQRLRASGRDARGQARACRGRRASGRISC